MALISPAEARFYLTGLSGIAEDEKLETLIERVGAAIASHLGYEPVSAAVDPTAESTTYTEYMDGPGGQELRLAFGPVSSVTSIYDDVDRAYGASTLVASTDYDTYGLERLVLLTTSSTHGAWSTARKAIKATYVAGWVTIPGPLKHAAGLWVQRSWKARGSGGIKTVSTQQGGSVTYEIPLGPMPPEVRELLAPYRLAPVVA